MTQKLCFDSVATQPASVVLGGLAGVCAVPVPVVRLVTN